MHFNTTMVKEKAYPRWLQYHLSNTWLFSLRTGLSTLHNPAPERSPPWIKIKWHIVALLVEIFVAHNQNITVISHSAISTFGLLVNHMLTERTSLLCILSCIPKYGRMFTMDLFSTSIKAQNFNPNFLGMQTINGYWLFNSTNFTLIVNL